MVIHGPGGNEIAGSCSEPRAPIGIVNAEGLCWAFHGFLVGGTKALVDVPVLAELLGRMYCSTWYLMGYVQKGVYLFRREVGIPMVTFRRLPQNMDRQGKTVGLASEVGTGGIMREDSLLRRNGEGLRFGFRYLRELLILALLHLGVLRPR